MPLRQAHHDTHLAPAAARAAEAYRTARSGEFEEISWDEALETATGWLGEVRGRDPTQLAFFTGRDQSLALTGWFAHQRGTPNFAAHNGFYSVAKRRRQTAGLRPSH
jgi:sulfite dehydrogenase (quinone) subunit SoeA